MLNQLTCRAKNACFGISSSCVSVSVNQVYKDGYLRIPTRCMEQWWHSMSRCQRRRSGKTCGSHSMFHLRYHIQLYDISYSMLGGMYNYTEVAGLFYPMPDGVNRHYYSIYSQCTTVCTQWNSSFWSVHIYTSYVILLNNVAAQSVRKVSLSLSSAGSAPRDQVYLSTLPLALLLLIQSLPLFSLQTLRVQEHHPPREVSSTPSLSLPPSSSSSSFSLPPPFFLPLLLPSSLFSLFSLLPIPFHLLKTNICSSIKSPSLTEIASQRILGRYF